MPNTPAAIGRGITVCCPGPGVSAAQRALAESLLKTVGQVAWVEDEVWARGMFGEFLAPDDRSG
jgi:pyrroline-5-carboxylate reductase